MVCKYTAGYIYQVAPGEFPFTATCSEKEEIQKISFYRNKKQNSISYLMVYIKYFFAPNLPIFWIRLAKKQEEGKKHLQLQNVVFHTKAITYCCYLIRQEI